MSATFTPSYHSKPPKSDMAAIVTQTKRWM